VVGDCNDDNRRLWRHGAQDLPGNVCRLVVCAHRCANDSTSGSGDRIKLRALLLTHSGARQAAQEATSSAARRSRETEGRTGTRRH